MRLIKEDTYRYESFFNFLSESIAMRETEKFHSVDSHKLRYAAEPAQDDRMNSKEYKNFQKIFSLQKEYDSVNDLDSICKVLQNTLTQIKNIYKAEIFFIDSDHHILEPLNKSKETFENNFFNVCLKEGIFNRVFEKGLPILIPSSQRKDKRRTNENYLIFPLLIGKERRGILALSTSMLSFSESSEEYSFINSIISLTINKIDLLKNKEELNLTYNELQVYQSKLSNDYKLSAIGELTSGIAEDILSPLQIILGYTDFLRKENNLNDYPSLDAINSQVKKVETVVKGLIKFANINDAKYKIQPCNLNEIITEYYNMVSSFLKNENYECILDFEKNIPPVLSHPNNIHQLLTNVFSLLKSPESTSGGILIQTKHQNDFVSVKFLSTDKIENGKNKNESLSLKIVEKLMKTHDGSVKTSSDENFGSTVLLTFPIKRKVA